MNCAECARSEGSSTPAVAVCIQCGAAVCDRHSIERNVQLVRIEPIGREVAVEPMARAIRCQRCDAAVQASRPIHYPIAYPWRRRARTKEHT